MIVGNFNTPLSKMDRTLQETSKKKKMDRTTKHMMNKETRF